MADTVDLDDLEEVVESPAALATKHAALAALVRDAKSVVVFTGAGISTSLGIPDYRGPDGVWVCQAQGRNLPKPSVEFADARPGVTHQALADLVGRGIVTRIVSQNVDGLHRRSGVPPSALSELHGNCFLEVCWGCGAEHLRDFDVCRLRNKACAPCRTKVPWFCHCTARKCGPCGLPLKDTVVHFEEQLPQKALKAALRDARAADLCIVLGSSLRVYPAADVPRATLKGGGRLVVVNKQRTPFDAKCAVRIFGDLDEAMVAVMNALPRIAASGGSGGGSGGGGSGGSGGGGSCAPGAPSPALAAVPKAAAAPRKGRKAAKAPAPRSRASGRGDGKKSSTGRPTKRRVVGDSGSERGSGSDSGNDSDSDSDSDDCEWSAGDDK